MKMTPINPKDYVSVPRSSPFLRIYKNGPMSLNMGAVQLLKLTAGEHVNFAYNELNELYMYKGEGFKCKGTSKNKKSLIIYSTVFCTKVLKEAKQPEATAASFRIASIPEIIEEVKYYAVFLGKANNVK